MIINNFSKYSFCCCRFSISTVELKTLTKNKHVAKINSNCLTMFSCKLLDDEPKSINIVRINVMRSGMLFLLFGLALRRKQKFIYSSKLTSNTFADFPCYLGKTKATKNCRFINHN